MLVVAIFMVISYIMYPIEVISPDGSILDGYLNCILLVFSYWLHIRSPFGQT